MSFEYGIRSICDFVAEELATSHLPEIALEHRSFFPDGPQGMIMAGEDHRQAVSYTFGPTISEPGIAERWQRFEAHYRAQKRISKFWMATIHNAIVEPRPLCVLSNGCFVREIMRPVNYLPKLFPEIDGEAIKRLVSPPSERFTSPLGFAPTARVDEASVGFGCLQQLFQLDNEIRLARTHLQVLAAPSEAAHSTSEKGVCSWIIGRYELSPQLMSGLQDPPIPRRRRRCPPTLHSKGQRQITSCSERPSRHSRSLEAGLCDLRLGPALGRGSGGGIPCSRCNRRRTWRRFDVASGN